jgi:hypothetical protein
MMVVQRGATRGSAARVGWPRRERPQPGAPFCFPERRQGVPMARCGAAQERCVW